jgi:uncharacterized membrane protein
MQLYRVKCLQCFRTRKYSLQHKCEWNLSLEWLFLAIFTFDFNCLDWVVLAHPKYSLKHKCEWNLSLEWLFLVIFTFDLSCLDWVVLAHPKYSLHHKCEWNLSLEWLFLAIFTYDLNYLDWVVLAHPFWALATFLVCFSVLICWTNRVPSMGTKWSSWI